MHPLLIIEDEHALAAALASVARRLGREAVVCASGRRGLEAAARGEFALALLDLGLPDMSGIEVLARLRERAPALPVVILTAHGSLLNALAARKLGAAAYLIKPLDLREVQETLRQVLSAPAPAPAARMGGSLGPLVGTSPVLQRAFVEIAHACASDAPVLLAGPTGTGKTLAARVIHEQSARKAAPFVALHCSALPEPLLESELFGYEKGAFTGALAAKTGHIERAEGGTLFLDEIADISAATQAKLLRFVEERVFSRVGGREELRVDCRLITATNKSLREEVRAGRFREDLYYRLHVLEIALPPLRERPEDLPALAAHFLHALATERRPVLAPAALELLRGHAWPGNVRELRNVLEHAVAVSNGATILPQHLPRELRERGAGEAPRETSLALEAALSAWLDVRVSGGAAYHELHDALEAMVLRRLLARFDGKPTVLARELKMNRVTLRKRLAELLGREHAEAE